MNECARNKHIIWRMFRSNSTHWILNITRAQIKHARSLRGHFNSPHFWYLKQYDFHCFVLYLVLFRETAVILCESTLTRHNIMIFSTLFPIFILFHSKLWKFWWDKRNLIIAECRLQCGGMPIIVSVLHIPFDVRKNEIVFWALLCVFVWLCYLSYLKNC